MARNSKDSSNTSEHPAFETARRQAAHRSQPKEARLLNLLSKDTSSGPGGGSTTPPSLRNEQELIAAVMQAFPGMSEEEARRELELHGGI